MLNTHRTCFTRCDFPLTSCVVGLARGAHCHVPGEVDGVVEAPNGAHFTSCAPDYERDEAFQREYVATAKSDEAWDAFRAKYIDVAEDEYQAAVL